VSDHAAKPPEFLFARGGSELHVLGRRFVRSFQRLLRTAQLHDRRNEALLRPLHELEETLDALHRFDSSWQVRVRNDYLHLCDERLKVEADIFPSYHLVLDELKRRGVGTLGLRPGLGEDGLLAFVHLFIAAGRLPAEEDAFAHLADRVREAGLHGVLLERLEEATGAGSGGHLRNVRHRSVLAFVKALCLTRDVLTAVDRDHVVNIRRVKRLVSSLVDIMNVDESVLLALTNIKNYDDYTFNHSVNVCVLAIATGRRLGLSRRQLGELGLAAIFHDLGKVNLPRDLVSSDAPLAPQEWTAIERHPVEGVRKLVQIKGVNEITNKLVVSVFRHHNNVDRTGYPPLAPAEEIPYFARIIRVADSFDAMTSARTYRARNLGGIEAMEELWCLAGTLYEPAILKVFVATVGIFPVGSVVQLSNGDVGVVARNHLEAEDLARPVVRAAARWDGQEIDPRDVDLRETPELEIVGYAAGPGAASTVLDLLL
jgi:HD-GYP domain-containing protein (c-di-GMP phosphodiesterase class II)